MKIAIIVPTYKNKEKLIRCLKSINFKKTNYEVIVVNDDSDNVITLDNNLVKDKNIKIINNKVNMWVKLARYEGFNSVSPDVTHLLTIDDDDDFISFSFENELKTYKTKIIQLSYNRVFSNSIEPEPAIEYNGKLENINGFLWGKIIPINIYKKIENFFKDDTTNDDGPLMKHFLKPFYDQNKIIIADGMHINHYIYKSSQSRSPKNLTRELQTYITLSHLYPEEEKHWNWKLVDRFSCKKHLLEKEERIEWTKIIKGITKIRFINRFIGFCFRWLKPYMWEDIASFIKGKRKIRN